VEVEAAVPAQRDDEGDGDQLVLDDVRVDERIRVEVAACAEVDELIEFIEASERGVIK